MSLADLTITDLNRLRQVAPLVRLLPGQSDAFGEALLKLGTRALGAWIDPHHALGTNSAEVDAVLAPLERIRDKIVELFGEPYTADLIARLRR